MPATVQESNAATLARAVQEPGGQASGTRSAPDAAPSPAGAPDVGAVRAATPGAGPAAAEAADTASPSSSPGPGPESAAGADSPAGEAAPTQGGGGSEAIRILGRALPTSASDALAASQTSADGEAARDRANLAAAPPSRQAPSGLTPNAEPAPGEEPVAGTAARASRVEDAEGVGEEPQPPETDHVVSEEPVPVGPSPGAVVDQAPEDPVARAQRFEQMIARMPVSDESVNTHPGPTPALELSGEADPGRVATQAADNEGSFGEEWELARRDMSRDEGVDEIFPTLPDEQLVASVSPGGGGSAPAGQLERPSLRPEVRAGVDAGLGPNWAAEVADAEAGHAAAMDQRVRDETARREETDREIATLEAEAAEEQLGHRAQAHAEVAAARDGWRAEIDTARGAYDGERTRIEGDLDREVSEQVRDAEGEAQQHLDQGQEQAEQQRRETESEADRRRAEAERQRDQADGFFDWVASRVRSFFRALQEGLKVLFDGLRAAVRTIIEGAKRLASAAIELGRRAVIGLIRVAGAALELAANVFLAAFPEARERAIGLIRRGVEVAEAGVNRVAELLRQGVHALLDALGAALIFILDAYEAFYSALFSVLEFVVLAYIEVQRAIFRLELAAFNAPAEIEGQVYEEMIGADLTQPLAFEATPGEIAAWESGLETGDAAAAAAPGGLGAETGAVPAMPTEVVAEPVASFDPDPELLASLDFSGGPVEFEGNTEPGNSMADLHAEASEGAADPSMDEAVAAGEAAGADPAAAMGDGGPGSAIPGETTDEKLEHYINNGNTHDCRTETPTEPEGPPMPLSAKIGPLTRAQRARYMLNQAWTGIQQWVRCNWPTILAAVLVALVVIAAIVAVVVLSGGTVGAALSGLLTVFTGAMLIYALARAAGFLGDYLQKSIDGDIIGGAKGLARAFAVAAVEIIFAVLTYVTAGAFRVVAAGIKGAGRVASAAARGAGRLASGAVRQTGRGVRAAGRGLSRVGRGVSRAGGRIVQSTGRVGRAASRAGSAVVRRGKLVIRNVRGAIGRGARRVRDLGRRLSRRLPFRRYRIIIRRRWLVLQGSINPWVDVAELNASAWVDDVAENTSRPGRVPQSGDMIRGTTEAGEEVTGRVFRGSRHHPDYLDLANQRGLDPGSNVIHHAIEQQVLRRFPGAFTRAEINSISRLRAISRGAYNARVHLSRIRRLWNDMYTAMGTRALNVAQQRRALTQFMGHVDEYIRAMERFSGTAAYRAAEQAGDAVRMRSLLDAETARLMALPRFDTARVINDIMRGL